ncbi:LamG domain-containing protein [Streptomyces sp. ME08-AFT2]|uniref:LamG domain-containing protein n=1 Tax=Streptomyces sp. ME08-AFT2 TaxID=3028683 RepID=UPI0029AC8BBD|nr:LamG-like jellyroll fold domain-containing protein [Streptomyces sp. ME08-AFT2]MDX3314185.1 LamG domain-containing protein [Streptomyces sp. ME08-AFT2]
MEYASGTAKAQASGEPVEVAGERTEYTTTMANPDGTFTLTQSSVPQRAKGPDGGWRSVDAALERRADGSVGPKAAVVDLRFADGGNGDGLIRLGGRKGSLTFDWPTPLSAPTLSGDTATYAEVFDGVDLRLTATSEGFREVLVVKSAEAAANPALAQIKLDVHADNLRVLPGAGGGISALDSNGNAVFKGPAGLMWDSAGSAPAAPRTTTGTTTQLAFSAPVAEVAVGDEPVADEADAPSKGDASEVLPVQVGNGTVAVTPDLGLLRGQDTVYPVYIDPPMGLGYSERTVLSSDGDRFWQFSGDHGVGYCASADGYYCGNGYTNRMYYEFAPTKLAGKKILDATFRAYETWSFNCDAHWVDLVRTDNISEATRWPGPAQRDWMGDRYVANGRGDLCSPSQPDSWVEFNDNPAEPDENLTPAVQSFADGRIARLTLMLRAKDESDPRAWKRFNQNAELQIQYVPKPGVPTQAGVIPGDGTLAYCEAESKPTIVTRADPMVQAAVQTQVQPASGEYQGALRAYLTVEKKGSDGTWAASWSVTSPSTGYHVDNTLEKVRISPREDGNLYRMRALTQSHWTYAGVTSSMSSAYSSWCYFKMDTTAPKPPQITLEPGNPYACTVTATCDGTGGPGVPGKFKLAANANDKDIQGYRWYLQDPNTVKETDPAQTVPTTVVEVAPTRGGNLTLVVEARDVRQRWGAKAEYAFKAALPQGPTGEWRFSEGSGTTAANAITDGGHQPVTLYPQAASAATFAADEARRGDGDHSLRLNDNVTDPAKRTGYASAPMPVDTAHSFTVSTWVMLTDASSTRAVLAAPGHYGVAFTVYYSAGDKKWVLNRTNHDGSTGVVAIRSVADYVGPPVNVWTHLAGVFNAGCTQAPCSGGRPVEADDTLQLFINGRPQGAPVNMLSASSTYQPWSAAGDMQIGRALVSGTYTQYFMGRIDETKVWQRALNEEALRWESALKTVDAPDTELVGQWRAAEAAAQPDGSTVISDKAPALYAASDLKAPSDSNATVELLEGENVVTLDGTSGYLRTTGPVIDESASFTVTAYVKLDRAKLVDKPIGYRAQVVGQATPAGSQSSWALWAEKVAPDAFVWRFGRTAVDGTGKVIASAMVESQELAPDEAVQLTGVFDAAEATGSGGFGKLHLFQNLEPQEPDTAVPGFSAYSQGSGELAVGRGAADGTTGHYLPGTISEVRIWAGSMTSNEIATRVLTPPPTA